jgi:putative peptide maturation dehydrogenase
MPRVRRTRYLVFCSQNVALPDIAAVLRGVARVAYVEQTYAISILRGEECPVTPEELSLLLSIPADRWVDSDGMDGGALDHFARNGLVLTDQPDESLAEFVRRDDALQAGQWNLYGAIYHFLTKWRDVNVDFELADSADASELTAGVRRFLDDFVDRHGPPPPAFQPSRHDGDVKELPLVDRRGGLYDALAKRKTTRGFDRAAMLTVEELATVLYYVFGCHGYAPMAGHSLMIKRTSPSGGGLHPIEVYPLINGVEGIEPGLYHYSGRDHALELISAIPAAELKRTANEFVCGQSFFGSAHVLFVLTARFYRSFWKYRRQQKAYSGLMMDAGHLSQTLYLVAAELGLGAFVTMAVNGENIEQRLGIDGWTEGVLAVSGCGRAAQRRQALLEPRFTRYVPRETELPMPSQRE